MKKVITMFIILPYLLLIPLNAFADGDPNIDSGGGDMGGSTGQNSWNPGSDGVRVTIVRSSDNQAVSSPIDFANNPPTDIAIHFGKVSKIQYRSGTTLTPNTGTYPCIFEQ